MAADNWTFHDEAIKLVQDGTIALTDANKRMRLYTSSSGINVSTVTDATTEDANEIAGSFGYTQGGTPVTMSVTQTAGVTKVDCTDGSWTANGGTITARYAAIIDISTTPDTVMFSTVLDNTPADVEALDGNVFSVQIDATNGVYQVSQV